MPRLAALALGAVLTLVVLAAGTTLAVVLGVIPANADAKPGWLERWAASTDLHAVVAREAPNGNAPIPADAKNLDTGLNLYANDCAVCHGLSDAKASVVAQGLYQKPPQLAKRGVERDPIGATYWKVEHGIRLTGMPAFGGTLTEEQIWQVVLFLKNMDHLPAAVDQRWKSLQPPLIGVTPAP